MSITIWVSVDSWICCSSDTTTKGLCNHNVSLSVTVTVELWVQLDSAAMRCVWVTGLLVFFFILMVSCNAPGCYWERTVDSRGLSRHRAACPFHKRASTLANQKRRTRAKEAVVSNFIPSSSASTSEPVSHWLSNVLRVGSYIWMWLLTHVSTLENLSRSTCEGPSEPEANGTSQASQTNIYGPRSTQCLHSRRLAPSWLREAARWKSWCWDGEQSWRWVGLWCRFVSLKSNHRLMMCLQSMRSFRGKKFPNEANSEAFRPSRTFVRWFESFWQCWDSIDSKFAFTSSPVQNPACSFNVKRYPQDHF